MIEISNLSKKFTDTLVVDNLSFSVQEGEVLGFLGPNGAGKSTTMKMLTGFLTPSAGMIKINGVDLSGNSLRVRKEIGYLPEGAPSYGEMTVYKFLYFIAAVRGMKCEAAKRAIAKVTEKLELQSVQHQTIDTLSKGFRRRVGLAQAILHDPKILILDEPTDGLDPNQKHQVRSLIESLSKDKIVIISTHILEEVTALCSRAIIINKGKLIVDDTPEALEARSDAEKGKLDDVFRRLTGGAA